MPHTSRAGVVSNGDLSREPGYVAPELEEGEQSSAGSSSSASAKKLDKSGDKPQDTEKLTQVPVRAVESRSSKDRPEGHRSSSSAGSTDTSSRATGRGQVRHRG